MEDETMTITQTEDLKSQAQRLYDLSKEVDNGAYFDNLRVKFHGEIKQPVKCAMHALENGFGVPMDNIHEVPKLLRGIGFDVPDLNEHELTIFFTEFGNRVLGL